MGKINTGRVILGGLVAGLVINIGEFVLNAVILEKQWKDAMAALNRPTGDQAIPLFVAGGFLLGVAVVWIYAAIRPRFGAGPGTAVCAGLIGWALGYAYGTIGLIAMQLFPAGMLVAALVWGLFELPIAAILGAWLYKEEPSGT